jgi:hypothetical protein
VHINHRMALLLLACLSWSSGTFAHKHPPAGACKAYFVVTEKDEKTVNLNMLGLNETQAKWYKKHGGEFPSLCPVNGDPSGKRITLPDAASESYIDSIVGDAPLYFIAWEEHRLYVPDGNGGHYAWSANGILSRWDQSKQDFVSIAPIHNTNRTILSSSSVSMLKDGLQEIQSRVKQ